MAADTSLRLSPSLADVLHEHRTQTLRMVRLMLDADRSQEAARRAMFQLQAFGVAMFVIGLVSLALSLAAG